MPLSYEYGTFANYSPRGTSALSRQSRGTCAAIKRGRVDIIESAIPHLRDPKSDVLRPFLAPDVALVPVPRSAPLPEGALWPSKAICDVLVGQGFGKEVMLYVRRTRALPKSSQSLAAERPLVPDHMESMILDPIMFEPDKITLVDDVLTLGRTSFACAQLLSEACPNAEIRIFALIRTQSLQEDIEAIVDPATGTITGFPSGKTHRDP